MPDSAEQLIINRLAQAPSFHPSGAKLFVPDWTLDPGDVVTVQSDGESYDVPIYSMDLTWNGACRADIQSTGNQQREPLSALRRKEYQTGRRGYGTAKQIEEQTQQQYEHYTEQTDAYRKEIYRVNGVVYDSNGNIVYQTDPVTGEIIYDNAGNPIPVYNEQSNGSISGQVIQSAQRMATIITQSGVVTEVFDINKDYAAGDCVLYPDSNGTSYRFTKPHSHGAWKGTGENGDVEVLGTFQTQIDQNTTGVLNAVGYVQRVDNRVQTIEGSTLWNDEDEIVNIIGSVSVDTQSGKVIINNGYGLYTNEGGTQYGYFSENNLDAGVVVNILNGDKTHTTIKADMINLVGVVNSTEMDTRLLNADALFSNAGYIGTITASGVHAGGNIVAEGSVIGAGLYIGTSAPYTDVSTAVSVIRKKTSGLADGEIGFEYHTLGSSTWIPINFNIADTATYKNGVASAKLQVGLNAMGYTEVQGTNYPSSQTIFTDTTGRTDASGADANLHRDITLSLDVDDNYVYMKHGSDIIARINNTGGGGGGGSYYATFLDNITLESTDIGDSVTKYSIANYSDGHRDSAANTRVVIDASAVYSAGVTAGLGGVVNVVKGSWSAGRCDFDPSAGTGQSQRVNLSYSIVKPGFYSSTDETTINVLDSSSSVGLPLNLVICRRQFGSYNYACLFKNGDSLTQGNVLAKFSIDGSAVISDVASILQNGRITYQDADKKIANIPVTAYDDEDNALLSTTITANMSDTWDAGYETGYAQGSGVSILDQYSTTIDSNNTTITLLPSDKGNYNVMASANVRIQVPVHEGIQGATLLASTDSDSAWSGWQLNDYTTLSKKYGFIRITGNDGSTYSYGIDANGVFDAGVSAGSGVQIETSKSYGSTVTETGTYTINPSSGYDAMRRATFSVRVPTVPRIQSTLAYGTASMGSHTVYPDEDYDAMQRVTFTVPNVTVETQRNQPTTGVTTTNIKVGNNIKVIVKFGNATVHQQIFAATT